MNASGADGDEDRRRTVLVVGATGVFGRRYAEGLCRIGGFRLVLAGRDFGKAEQLAEDLRRRWTGVDVAARAFDRRTATAAAIRASGAGIVADLAGPFQGSDYGLARAAIEACAHYLDIADGRAFVAGFDRLDAQAKDAGVAAVTGVSSTPALSHAALDQMTQGWRRIDQIEVGIVPGNRAPRGISVVRAILSWAGQPIAAFRGGRVGLERGWGRTHRGEIAGLGRRWLSLADTPDLDRLPARYRPTRDALFFAGVELAVMHLGLAAASRLVRWNWIASLAPAASVFRWVAGLLEPFGTDRGGMVATVQGLDRNGASRRSTFSLVAASGDGPNVPILGALALTGRLAEGAGPAPGARASPGIVSLEAFEAEMQPFAIKTRIDSVSLDGLSLFPGVVPHFDLLPAAVRDAHRVDGTRVLRGKARIDGGETALARLIARGFRFPKAAQDVPVEVEMRQTGTPARPEERWTRRFGDSEMVSHLTPAGSGALEERFGPFAFRLGFHVADGRLVFRTEAVRFLSLPLPKRLAGLTEAFETVDDEGRFVFDIRIAMPVLGRLAHYRGWLV